MKITYNSKAKGLRYTFWRFMLLFTLTLTTFAFTASANSGPFVARTSIDADTIQCEDYDIGGYYALAPGRLNKDGYRDNGDTIGVVTENGVTGIKTQASHTDWAEYSVGSVEAGDYKVTIRFANGYWGFILDQYNGVGGTKTAIKSWYPSTTGGWNQWVELEDTVTLKGGDNQVIRLGFMNYAHVDWIAFEKVVVPSRAYVERASIDADTIQAEDYDIDAYFVEAPGRLNKDGYRDNGDTIGVVTENGVTGIKTQASHTDWAEYSVGSVEAGDYKVTIRFANGYWGFILDQYNGVGGTKTAIKSWYPSTTGGWNQWVELEDTVTLKGGDNQVIRLGFMNYAHVDWIAFEKVVVPGRAYVERDSIDQDTIQIEDYDIKAYYAAAPALPNSGYRDGDTAGVVGIGGGYGVRTNDTKVNWTEFSVGKVVAGKYKFSIRYTNGYNGITVEQFNGIGGTKTTSKKINFPTHLGWDDANFDIEVDTIALTGGEDQIIRLTHFSWAIIDWMAFELVEAAPPADLNFVAVDYTTEVIGTSNAGDMLPAGTIWNRHEGQGTVVNLDIVHKSEAPAGYALTDSVLKIDAKTITRWWDGIMFEFAKDVNYHESKKYLHVAYYLPVKSTVDVGLIKNWLKKRGVGGNAWSNDAGVEPVLGMWYDLVLEVTEPSEDVFTHFEFMGFPADTVSYIGKIEFTDSPEPRFMNFAENYVAVDYNNNFIIPGGPDNAVTAVPGAIWNRDNDASTKVDLEIIAASKSPKGYSLTDSVLKVDAKSIGAWWHGLMFQFDKPATYNPEKKYLHVAYYLPSKNNFDNSQVRNWLKLTGDDGSAIIWNNAPDGWIPKTGVWADAVIEVDADDFEVNDTSFALAFNHFEFFGVPANNVSYIGSIEFTNSPEPRFVNIPANYILTNLNAGEQIVVSTSDTIQNPGSIWFRTNGSTSVANLSVVNTTEAPAGYNLTNKVIKIETGNLERWYDGLMIDAAKTVTYDTLKKYMHVAYYIPELSSFNGGIFRMWLKNGAAMEWKESVGIMPKAGGWVDFVIPVVGTTSGSDSTLITHFELFGFPANATSYVGSIIFSDSDLPRFDNKVAIKSVDYSKYLTFTKNRTVFISGLQTERVQLFDLQGRILLDNIASGSTMELPVAEAGIYIIKIDNFVKKVSVK